MAKMKRPIATYNLHPLTKIFPPMPEEDFEALVEDIKKNGLREPIWLDERGRIIDGRHRYKACLRAGVDPRFRTKKTESEKELREFVISLNMKRRNLSEGQRSIIAVRLSAPRPRGRRSRKEQDSTVSLLTNEELAELHGISIPSIKRARAVVRYGIPRLQDAVFNGSVALQPAFYISKEKETIQTLTLDSLNDGEAPNPTAALKAAKQKSVLEKYKRAGQRAAKAEVIQEIEKEFGKYRAILLQSDFGLYDTALGTGAGKAYTSPLEKLRKMPIPALLHEEGGLVWIRTSWAALRSGYLRSLLDGWHLDWVAEILCLRKRPEKVSHRQSLLRPMAEMVVLARPVQRKKRARLLDGQMANVVDVVREGDVELPNEVLNVITRQSPEPRLQILGPSRLEGWAWWNPDMLDPTTMKAR